MKKLSLLKTLVSNKKGTIALIIALCLPIIVGAVSMGVEVGGWYAHSRQLQTAADAAALAAAYSMVADDEDGMDVAAEEEAERNDFDIDNGTIVVNNPPEAGEYADDDEAVEVVITDSYPLFFMSAFRSEAAQIQVRAVASGAFQPSDNPACVLALDDSACGAIQAQGSASVSLDGCVVASNSDCSCAVKSQGSAEIAATTANVVGGVCEQGGGVLDFETEASTGVPPAADPYEDIEVPVYAGCDHNNLQLNGPHSTTLSPGVYCNGLKINESGPTTMQSGVYIIDRGEFRVNSTAEVSGTDVTIILTSSTGSNYATVHINGSCTLDLTAPTSGTYSGVLFYGDRDSGGTGSALFNGTSDMDLNGALYFPSDGIEFKGNNSSGDSCTQLIGSTVLFTGNSGLAHDCTDNGTSNINPYEGGGVSLVE